MCVTNFLISASRRSACNASSPDACRIPDAACPVSPADDATPAVIICSETNLHEDLVLAAAAAGILQAPERHAGETYVLTGPDAVACLPRSTRLVPTED